MDGSNRRESEEQTYIFFTDFLDACEGKLCMLTTYHYEVGIVFFLDKQVGCSVEDVLVFFSGADCLPPLGFHRSPELHFLEPADLFPTASTCSLILRLPTRYHDYESFKVAMVQALTMNDGFGAGP